MTFRRSLYLSFAAHILIFGSAIAIARYAGVMVASFPRAIQVSLVSSGPDSGRGTGAARGPQPRPYQSASQAPDLPVEHRHEVPEDLPADPGATSLTPMEEQGTAGRIIGGNEGGHMIAPAGMGNGGNQEFGLIPPEQWSAIESAIERTKKYPRLARERGIEGVVRLRFRLGPEGSIEKMEIIESSGSDILDNASVRAVYRAAPMPAVSGWVEMPMKYVLK